MNTKKLLLGGLAIGLALSASAQKTISLTDNDLLPLPTNASYDDRYGKTLAKWGTYTVTGSTSDNWDAGDKICPFGFPSNQGSNEGGVVLYAPGYKRKYQFRKSVGGYSQQLGTAVAINSNWVAMSVHPTYGKVYLERAAGSFLGVITDSISAPVIPLSNGKRTIVYDFGTSMVMNENTLAISAPGSLTITGTDTLYGLVVIYKADNIGGRPTWTRTAVITAPSTDRNIRGNFGQTLGISTGNSIIIGSPTFNNHTGAAYIVKKQSDTQWNHVYRYAPGVTEDGFGRAVSINNEFAVATGGSPDRSTARINVFKWNGSSYNLDQYIWALPGDWIHGAVALNNNTNKLVAGPGTEQRFGAEDKIVLFERTGTATEPWKIVAYVRRNTTINNTAIGNSLAFDNEEVVAGMWSYSSGAPLCSGTANVRGGAVAKFQFDNVKNRNARMESVEDANETVSASALLAPNPVAGNAVEFLSESDILNVTASSINGVQKQLSFNGRSIQIEELESGLHFLKIETSAGTKQVKLIVQ